MERAARGSGRRREAPMSGTPIVNEIRRLLFEHGEMTQEELAQACGVTRQTIIAMEAGRYGPSLGLAFRTALAFGVGLEVVFGWGSTWGGCLCLCRCLWGVGFCRRGVGLVGRS